MADFFLNAGDTASPIFETLEDDTGAAVDIQGATVKITVTPIRGGTPIINDKAAVNLQVGDGSDGSKGQVAYGQGAAPYAAGETSTAGDYLYLWKVTFAGTAVQTFPNDGYRLLTITPDAPTTQAVYISREELKKTLQLSAESYADADIDVAITAASRGLEAAYDTIWQVSTDTMRYYQAYGREVILGDVLHVTSIGLDYTWPWPGDDYPYSSDWGSGTYSTALASTDYQLLPTRNGRAADGGNGEPYRKLELVRGASYYTLPSGLRAVRITGVFGWETVPAGVRSAATILATRLLRRAREAPFGIHAIGIEGATMTAQSLARDPEIGFAIAGLKTPRSLVI